jgi:flagellar biosynthesis/type III secretory pathway protein FliH
MNSKQQTTVDSIIEFMKNNQYFIGNDLYEFFDKAKEMEIAGKETSYADGYAEGYKRALEYMYQVIYTQIKIKE